MSDKFHLTKSPSNTQLLPEYNVLVLGETHSGKSTLIEYMRKYADPLVEINTKALGTGFLSHTRDVIVTDISTDLPEYYVQEKKGVGRVNYGGFLISDQYDYEDALNMRKGLEPKKGASRLPKKVKFNLIDTLSLTETVGDELKHIQMIYRAFLEFKTLHLIIVTISSGPFTQGLKDAIKVYVDMFPGFSGIIAFVNTHFDYKNFYHELAQVSHAIDLRTESLHEIMGRTTFPHFKINCDVHNRKPIRDCITNNVIQEILELATSNQPVDTLRTVIRKTRTMRDIDNILRAKFDTILAAIENNTWPGFPEQGITPTESFRRESRILDLEARIKAVDEHLAQIERREPVLVHEERRHLDDKYHSDRRVVTVQFPEDGRQPLPIVDRSITMRNVVITREEGSRSASFWRADFMRTGRQNCFFHVKLYSTLIALHQPKIQELRQERTRLEAERLEAIKNRELQEYEKVFPIRESADNHRQVTLVLKYASEEILEPEAFFALMHANAYIGDAALCVVKVEKVYMDLARTEPKQRTKQSIKP